MSERGPRFVLRASAGLGVFWTALGFGYYEGGTLSDLGVAATQLLILGIAVLLWQLGNDL